MGKRGWIIFAVVVLGLITSLVIWKSSTSIQIDVSSVDGSKILAASEANGNIADHVFGSTEGKVVLVEYGDIQCTACASAHPQMKILSEEYKGQLSFVFRNFPISQAHPNARAAAGAVEAAGLQGKYWEMNNLMYETQSEWSSLAGTERDAKFLSYAKQVGVDEAKFTTDLTSEAIKQKLAYDKALALKTGVDATPTFYLNGVKVESEVVKDLQTASGEKLRALINEQLFKAGIAPPVTATE